MNASSVFLVLFPLHDWVEQFVLLSKGAWRGGILGYLPTQRFRNNRSGNVDGMSRTIGVSGLRAWGEGLAVVPTSTMDLSGSLEIWSDGRTYLRGRWTGLGIIARACYGGSIVLDVMVRGHVAGGDGGVGGGQGAGVVHGVLGVHVALVGMGDEGRILTHHLWGHVRRFWRSWKIWDWFLFDKSWASTVSFVLI